MTESEFDALIKQALAENLENYIPEEELDYTPHKFSRRFERNMKKIIKSVDKKPQRFSKKKLAVCLIAAIIAISVATLSVSAVRDALKNFIVNTFSDHSDVRSVPDENAPKYFAQTYSLQPVPDGYKLDKYNENIFEREYIYRNENSKLCFSQNIKAFYDVAENTEGYEMEYVTIDGCEGYYIDQTYQNGKTLVWDNGDYVLTLLITGDETFSITKEQFFELAEYVKPIDE